jgi:pyridoxine/pyridoxamine 5'-phosphate oxidase
VESSKQSLIYNFLTRFKLGVISTMSAENMPQSALVGIAITPQLEVIFDTINTTRKYKNLIAEPACSFVIGWAGEQTVQYEGKAEELTKDNREKYQTNYFSAWPDASARMAWPGIAYFVVRPKWMRYSDFDQTPPLIQEFEFKP